eukprot:TRINITY_DN1273_c0_g1_i18.p1 TRINITY_DN1273_c0_g1~~TRINITY_DN1273_c0_g1_i18.p1  ORF type:complete len:172 (+),score=42.90 TRINITY_DN1273_c0_g1_i18:36-551(+)
MDDVKNNFFFFKQKTAYEISACLVGSEMCIRDSATAVVYFYLFSHLCSIGTLSWVLISELLPEVGVSLANFVIWVSQLIIGLFFPTLGSPDNLNIYGVFLIFAGLTFFSIIFFAIFLPETKGKSKTEILSFYDKYRSPQELRKEQEMQQIQSEQVPLEEQEEKENKNNGEN